MFCPECDRLLNQLCAVARAQGTLAADMAMLADTGNPMRFADCKSKILETRYKVQNAWAVYRVHIASHNGVGHEMSGR